MLISFALLIAGLVFLVLAGDYLVRGTVAASLKLGVSQILASVLIVGFGTSAPEMLVALEATMAGTPGLAMGNIVGSNIANVLLVVGAPALMMSLKTTGAGLLRSTLFTIVATIVWLVVTPVYGLTPFIGVAFIFALILYITGSLIRPPTDNLEDLISEEAKEPPPGWVLTAFFILLGVIGLPLGSHLAIRGATGIASEVAWLNDELVGLTLLAIGTSMPEFAAAMAAARRKETDVVFGNVVGSNMFNILGAGGIIAMFGPLDLPGIFVQFDYWFMGGAFALVSLYVLFRRPIGWFLGILLLAAYGVYLYGLHHFYVLGLNWSALWS
ncbi:MAG: calcium:sodium antiporter [Ponticaulis sp.]|nr:calcium:sodium antiporter [Ponticaulis sp.]|tara:strand:- start:1159 stop:2139 length:981 start_codon:yes stop_codon:yes gene_type:complete